VVCNSLSGATVQLWVFVSLDVGRKFVFDLVLKLERQFGHELEYGFLQRAHPPLQSIHHFPRLVEIEHDNSACLLQVFRTKHDWQEICFLSILKHPDINLREVLI
jgi:hypothetical protein